MFRELNLKFFRQHEDRTFHFDKGVVALRGANEAGKTTILEAIAFAFFGATSLRESLEDVVTYDHKPTELRVRLVFELNGTEYTVTRHKGGCELNADSGLKVTGQKVVTEYIEKLLGADADTCRNLMLANQTSIRGALAKGPTAAVELIESLSNLGMIDKVISLVQDKLPGGNTRNLEGRIAALEQQEALPVEDTTAELVVAHNQAKERVRDAEHLYQKAKQVYDAVQPDAQAAQRAVNEHAAMASDVQRKKTAWEQAKVTSASITIPPLPTNIPELRQRVADRQAAASVAAARKATTEFKTADAEWEGSLDDLIADRDATKVEVDRLTKAMNDNRVKVAGLVATKITQTACGLCGKDLTNVPEVAEKNAKVDADVEALNTKWMLDKASFEEKSNYYALCSRIVTVHHENMRIFQKCHPYVELDHNYVPNRWKWIGPAEDTMVAGNPVHDLQQAEAAERAHHAAKGRAEQAVTALQLAAAAYSEAAAKLTILEAGLDSHKATLTNAAELLSDLSTKEVAQHNARSHEQLVRGQLDMARAVLNERKAAHERLKDELKKARDELAEMRDNNALIEYLRQARPVLSDQVWAMSMGAVSSYFSQIRGTPSVMTREDNGFKVDGRNITGLSGSTQDAAGLAIRKALTKTFLPNVPFLILDEPAAACDDDRESNMLGLIASGGFEQVLLVTHSDLADSFASQVVQV